APRPAARQGPAHPPLLARQARSLPCRDRRKRGDGPPAAPASARIAVRRRDRPARGAGREPAASLIPSPSPRPSPQGEGAPLPSPHPRPLSRKRKRGAQRRHSLLFTPLPLVGEGLGVRVLLSRFRPLRYLEQ